MSVTWHRDALSDAYQKDAEQHVPSEDMYFVACVTKTSQWFEGPFFGGSGAAHAFSVAAVRRGTGISAAVIGA